MNNGWQSHASRASRVPIAGEPSRVSTPTANRKYPDTFTTSRHVRKAVRMMRKTSRCFAVDATHDTRSRRHAADYVPCGDLESKKSNHQNSTDDRSNEMALYGLAYNVRMTAYNSDGERVSGIASTITATLLL